MRLRERAAAAPCWQQATSIGAEVDAFSFPYLGAPWDHSCTGLRSRNATVSVVIPTWNSTSSIPYCLRSLALCSLNRLAQHRLEVIVCDDGSTDGSWRAIRRASEGLALHAYHLPHGGQSAAANFGIDRAAGGIVVCCDSDMILGCGALDELAARHERWTDAVCLGFRSDVGFSALDSPDCPWGLMHQEAFSRDNRVSFDVPTIIPNMLTTSRWLGRLTGERGMVDSQGSEWRRHRFLYGCLFSAPRGLLRRCDGFPDALVGWGYNDTLVGARLEAAGGFLLPVVSAWGHHVEHDLRHRDQWRQYARNKLAYEYVLDQETPWTLWRAANRPTARAEHHTTLTTAPTSGKEATVAWEHRTLHALGMWDRCLQLAEAAGADDLRTECLFRLGRYNNASASEAGGHTLWGALSHLRSGRSGRARAVLQRGAPDDSACAYAASASRPELLYLARHYDSIDIPDAARLFREVADLIGGTRDAGSQPVSGRR